MAPLAQMLKSLKKMFTAKKNYPKYILSNMFKHTVLEGFHVSLHVCVIVIW